MTCFKGELPFCDEEVEAVVDVFISSNLFVTVTPFKASSS